MDEENVKSNTEEIFSIKKERLKKELPGKLEKHLPASEYQTIGGISRKKILGLIVEYLEKETASRPLFFSYYLIDNLTDSELERFRQWSDSTTMVDKLENIVSEQITEEGEIVETRREILSGKKGELPDAEMFSFPPKNKK